MTAIIPNLTQHGYQLLEKIAHEKNSNLYLGIVIETQKTIYCVESLSKNDLDDLEILATVRENLADLDLRVLEVFVIRDVEYLIFDSDSPKISQKETVKFFIITVVVALVLMLLGEQLLDRFKAFEGMYRLAANEMAIEQQESSWQLLMNFMKIITRYILILIITLKIHGAINIWLLRIKIDRKMYRKDLFLIIMMLIVAYFPSFL